VATAASTLRRIAGSLTMLAAIRRASSQISPLICGRHQLHGVVFTRVFVAAPVDVFDYVFVTEYCPNSAGAGCPVVRAGFGPDIHEQFRDAADYVDRILKGAKPGELPVQQPTNCFYQSEDRQGTWTDYSAQVLSLAEELVE
jgi:hypothetical protein